MTPWKPLPLLTPVTLTLSPGAKTSTVTAWPTVKLVLAPHLDEVTLGSDTRLLEVPEQGLVEPFGLDVAEGDLGGGVAVGVHGLLLGDHAGARPG